LFLQKAEQKVADTIGRIRKLSLVYESEPWGFQAKQYFLNRVALVETELSAKEVLKKILSIETEMGRQRLSNGYSSRQIDIDILYFNEMIIEQPDLIVPHPGIPGRRFVLLPLVEVAGQFIHPVFGQSNAALLEKCSDKLKVWVYQVT
jgi:2-amino-4-hydroxy-6-hydroxymethyldihydropteridine diphosphokinase